SDPLPLSPSPCLPVSEQSPAKQLNGASFASANAECTIIDVGHQRDLDLAIEVPPSDLGAVCMHEQWAEINTRLCELIQSHRSTLIFVNTRRMAERVAHHPAPVLGEAAVRSARG